MMKDFRFSERDDRFMSTEVAFSPAGPPKALFAALVLLLAVLYAAALTGHLPSGAFAIDQSLELAGP